MALPLQTISPVSNALVSGTQQHGSDTPVMLAKKFTFGARAEATGGVHFLDEFTVLWAAGKSVVVYNTSQPQQQKYLYTSDGCEGISCIATSTNRRLVAVAESGASPLINVYSYEPNKIPKFSLRKTLHLGEHTAVANNTAAADGAAAAVPMALAGGGARDFVSLCFSADGRYLVALTGYPEWNLVLFGVEKARVVASVAVLDKGNTSQDHRLLSQCSISPKDPALMCVSGNGVFKFFRFMDGQLRQSAGGIRGDPGNYLAHMWLPPEDRMIVSTDNGDLLLIENCEYRFPLPLSPSDGLSINALVPHSKGFICGGEMGLVTIYERTEDRELYRKMRTLKVEQESRDGDVGGGGSHYAGSGEESARVLAFSLTPPPGEENMAILTSSKQVLTLNLSNADFSRADDQVCEHICQPFHSGPITGLDMCISKPLIVTAGKDRNIIVWNYLTNTVECRKHFSTEILSVAIHPSGLHLIVGFPDKLRFMNIYGDDIRELRSYGIRSCTECRFSNGGQFFAAVTNALIHVYSTYSCELIGHLRGHNGKIKNLFFVPPDDTRILSVGHDGAVMEFSLTDFHKVNDHVIKAVAYNSVTGDSQSVWAAGNDRKLRYFERLHLQQQGEYDTRNAPIMCMSQSSALRLLFAGCEDGTLRVFNTYLAEKNASERRQNDKHHLGAGEGGAAGGGNSSAVVRGGGVQDILVESHTVHQGPITRICMSFDEELVVTAGEDGVVSIFEVTAPHKGGKKEIKFTEEILIEKRDLDDRVRGIADLQSKVHELQQRKQFQSAKRRRKHEELMNNLQDEHREEKMRQDAQFFKLDSEISEQKLRFGEGLRSLDQKHVQDRQRIDQEYNTRIQSLRDRSHKLRHAVDEQRKDFEEKLSKRETHWEKSISDKQDGYSTALQAVGQSIVEVMNDETDLREEADEVGGLIEEGTEVEMVSLKEAFEKQRSTEETYISKLQSENSTLSNEEKNKRQDLDAKRSDIAEKVKQQGSLDLQVEGLHRDIDALTSELRERSDTISDKDKRIYELKKKNQELEKFKFVLEYKIKELRSQIEPREEEIKQAQAKYAEMEEESTRYLTSNESLVLQIRTLKLKVNGITKEVDQSRNRLQDSTEFQSRLWTEISDLHDEKNVKRLKDLVKGLYSKYASQEATTAELHRAAAAPTSSSSMAAAAKSSSTAPSGTTEDDQRGYNREREYLERTLGGLKKKLVKDAGSNRTDRARIVNEHVTLIKEINELRREVRTLNAAKEQAGGGDGAGGGAGSSNSPGNKRAEGAQRELQIQRAEIYRLRGRVEELERDVHAAGRAVSTIPL